jgi:hypothetical protein
MEDGRLQVMKPYLWSHDPVGVRVYLHVGYNRMGIGYRDLRGSRPATHASIQNNSGLPHCSPEEGPMSDIRRRDFTSNELA